MEKYLNLINYVYLGKGKQTFYVFLYIYFFWLRYTLVVEIYSYIFWFLLHNFFLNEHQRKLNKDPTHRKILKINRNFYSLVSLEDYNKYDQQ